MILEGPIFTSDPCSPMSLPPLVPCAAASVPAPALDASNARIEALAAEILAGQHEQIPMPVTHRFAPGIYLREIFMPAGAFVIGHEHRTEHFNVVLTGRANVIMTHGQTQEIKAGDCFVSGAGVRKVLAILEDMRWQTIHANPTDDQDIVAIEERLLVLTPEFLNAKGRRALDDFRMSQYQPATLPPP